MGPQRLRAGRIVVSTGVVLAILTTILLLLGRVGAEAPSAVLLAAASLILFVVFAAIGRAGRPGAFYAAGGAVPAGYNGMATAAAGLGSAAFLGIAGQVFVLGHDGLAYAIGFAAGLVLVAVLFAPFLRKSGAYTLPDFLALRFGSRSVRLAALAVVVIAAFVLLVGQLAATGLLVERVLGFPYRSGLWFAAAVALFCALMGGARSVTLAAISQYVVIVAGFVLTAVLASLMSGAGLLPMFGYGTLMTELSARESELLADGLLGGGFSLDPPAFTAMHPLQFLAGILVAAFGTACLPHIVSRAFAARSVNAARATFAWALGFSLPVLLVAPAYAYLVKLAVARELVGRPLAAISSGQPAFALEWGGRGLVRICGEAARSAEAIAAACGRIAGHPGLLRWSDLSLDPDLAVLGVASIFGLPPAIGGLLAAAALAACLAAASALLAIIGQTASRDLFAGLLSPRSPQSVRIAFGRLSIFAGALAGVTLAAEPALPPPGVLLQAALNIAAGGLFPALVLSIWWSRTTARGVLAGIIAGGGTTGLILVGAAEIGLYSGAACLVGIPAGFAVAILLSLAPLRQPASAAAFADALRRPGGVMADRELG
jgi:cation/acetate symporter